MNTEGTVILGPANKDLSGANVFQLPLRVTRRITIDVEIESGGNVSVV
jgi:hypothetical protein